MQFRIITVGDSSDTAARLSVAHPHIKLLAGRLRASATWLIAPCIIQTVDRMVNKIIEGHATYSVDNKPVAVDGCRTECGCRLIGSVSATVD